MLLEIDFTASSVHFDDYNTRKHRNQVMEKNFSVISPN